MVPSPNTEVSLIGVQRRALSFVVSASAVISCPCRPKHARHTVIRWHNISLLHWFDCLLSVLFGGISSAPSSLRHSIAMESWPACPVCALCVNPCQQALECDKCQAWWISIISFSGLSVDFVVGVGFRVFARGFWLLAGGFRVFRLLAGPINGCTQWILHYDYRIMNVLWT